MWVTAAAPVFSYHSYCCFSMLKAEYDSRRKWHTTCRCNEQAEILRCLQKDIFAHNMESNDACLSLIFTTSDLQISIHSQLHSDPDHHSTISGSSESDKVHSAQKKSVTCPLTARFSPYRMLELLQTLCVLLYCHGSKCLLHHRFPELSFELPLNALLHATKLQTFNPCSDHTVLHARSRFTLAGGADIFSRKSPDFGKTLRTPC